MFQVIAAILFAIALVLHLMHATTDYTVQSFWLGGCLAIAISLIPAIWRSR